MIESTQGNILQADAEALVNTVNCVGAMGKGIALQFKQAFPANYKAYKRACTAKEVVPGKMFLFHTGKLVNPRYIVNFPTKNHWRGKSKIEDIESGLEDLVQQIQKLEIRSIAIPPLGCGLGGLKWSKVRPLIEESMQAVPDVQVLLFDPKGAPEARDMPVRTERPKMTPARALFVRLMDQYLNLDYRLTLLEIQKLAYFLQEAGEPLRLRYESGTYGPYADNLNKVLERIEGHLTRGYEGSRKPDTEIELLPGAVDEATSFLSKYPESLERLEKVAGLIAGFETPYGMELLSSTHWVTSHEEDPARDAQGAVERIHAWNERKRRIFRPPHIRVAWDHLAAAGWSQAPTGAPSLSSPTP